MLSQPLILCHCYIGICILIEIVWTNVGMFLSLTFFSKMYANFYLFLSLNFRNISINRCPQNSVFPYIYEDIECAICLSHRRKYEHHIAHVYWRIKVVYSYIDFLNSHNKTVNYIRGPTANKRRHDHHDSSCSLILSSLLRV